VVVMVWAMVVAAVLVMGRAAVGGRVGSERSQEEEERGREAVERGREAVAARGEVAAAKAVVGQAAGLVAGAMVVGLHTLRWRPRRENRWVRRPIRCRHNTPAVPQSPCTEPARRGWTMPSSSDNESVEAFFLGAYIVQPDRAGTLAVVCAAGSSSSVSVAELSADDACSGKVPPIVHHCAPHTIVIDLDASLHR
jgi:hypothetical protein